jgi:hypothetical protein
MVKNAAPAAKIKPVRWFGVLIILIWILTQSAPDPGWVPPYSRAGFGLSTSADAVNWAHRLGADWYLDWSVSSRYPVEYPEFWQMVRLAPNFVVKPDPQKIRSLARGYPGSVWIIGNEPDNISQDNLTPEDYAHRYHQLYTLIKAADPSAKIAVGGVSQATPLRLEYLDRVLKEYKSAFNQAMPVDWWTLHGYVLREERGSWGVDIPPGLKEDQGKLYEVSDHGSVSLFQDQIKAFRSWMKANGYQNVPLALTEFGILLPAPFGYTPEVISRYLKDTFNWLDGAADKDTGYPADQFRLVQRWAWFSLADKTFPTSDLLNVKTGQLTLIGEAYRSYTMNK